jgi:hypothetical protein
MYYTMRTTNFQRRESNSYVCQILVYITKLLCPIRKVLPKYPKSSLNQNMKPSVDGAIQMTAIKAEPKRRAISPRPDLEIGWFVMAAFGEVEAAGEAVLVAMSEDVDLEPVVVEFKLPRVQKP